MTELLMNKFYKKQEERVINISRWIKSKRKVKIRPYAIRGKRTNGFYLIKMKYPWTFWYTPYMKGLNPSGICVNRGMARDFKRKLTGVNNMQAVVKRRVGHNIIGILSDTKDWQDSLVEMLEDEFSVNVGIEGLDNYTDKELVKKGGITTIYPITVYEKLYNSDGRLSKLAEVDIILAETY